MSKLIVSCQLQEMDGDDDEDSAKAVVKLPRFPLVDTLI